MADWSNPLQDVADEISKRAQAGRIDHTTGAGNVEIRNFGQPDWWEVTKPGVGTNRYSYSFNDPVNLSDPGGNCSEEKGCNGEWGEEKAEPSENQSPDGLQDVSNYGEDEYLEYIADPKAFNTENNFDFDGSIQNLAKTPGNPVYDAVARAKETGEEATFKISTRTGGRIRDFFTKSGSSLGRLKTDVSGTVSIDKEGNVRIDGRAELSKTGTYDWKPDGGSNFHNFAIRVGGSRLNMRGSQVPDYGEGDLYRDGRPVRVQIARDYYYHMELN